MNQLHEILKIMLAYKDAVDGLYGYSVAEFTRRQERGARIEARTKKGQWGIRETDEDGDHAGIPGGWGSGHNEDMMLPSLRTRLTSLSEDFQSKVVVLLGDLAYQSDMDMRLLGVLLSFNEYVSTVSSVPSGLSMSFRLTCEDIIRLLIREGPEIKGEHPGSKMGQKPVILVLGMIRRHESTVFDNILLIFCWVRAKALHILWGFSIQG
jgi:hypothetical protein